ncbi:Alpha/Beta hydrolase protein, partial [Dunaliella salina]
GTHAGWNFWQWRNSQDASSKALDSSSKRVHWCAAGEIGAPPVLLIHGYGASAYHWRYNIPELAKHHRVYALCLLGFGWSEKAQVDYNNGKQWIPQIADFIEQVIWPEIGSNQRVVLVGNSLGGYASLAAGSLRPDLVRAVALLNGAGPFEDPSKPPADPNRQQTLIEQLQIFVTGLVKRVVLLLAFVRAKQPARIREVLELVYTNKEQLDDDLVDSIVRPATDPAAADVFYRINHRTTPPLTINALLARLQAPLLLLWGLQDPWITPAKAEQVRALYPSAQLVGLQAGHCPHDDDPVGANAALLDWLKDLKD